MIEGVKDFILAQVLQHICGRDRSQLPATLTKEVLIVALTDTIQSGSMSDAYLFRANIYALGSVSVSQHQPHQFALPAADVNDRLTRR